MPTPQHPSVVPADLTMTAFDACMPPWRGEGGFAISIDEAIESLLKQAGKAFDRSVVAALANYVDNRGGRAALMAMTGGPASTAAN